MKQAVLWGVAGGLVALGVTAASATGCDSDPTEGPSSTSTQTTTGLGGAAGTISTGGAGGAGAAGGGDPGPPRAFPGAVGFGADTRGAYGAPDGQEICIVNSRDDSGGAPSVEDRGGVSVYTGTFRQCIDQDLSAIHEGETWGKLIVFEVSGTILGSSPYVLRLRHPYVTIAGQTAPSPGVTLRNLQIVVANSDVVIQHLRIRVGDAVAGYDPDSRDAVTICTSQRDVSRVVVDHCSTSWAIDETVSLGSWDETILCSQVTVSHTIVSEALHWSLHPKSQPPDAHGHSKGLMAGAWSDHVSFIGNLIAHTADRNPLMQGRSGVAANNVIYNTNEWAASMVPAHTPGDLGFVGNVGKKGHNSNHEANDYALTLPGPGQSWISNPWPQAAESKLFVEDNISFSCGGTYTTACSPHTDAVYDATTTEWDGYLQEFPSLLQTASPLWPEGLVPLPAAQAEAAVLAFAGARPADRDSVDQRIVADVTAGTGRIINCVELDGGNSRCDEAHEVAGGWPLLDEHSRNLATEMSTPPGAMPGDPHGDDDSNGYSNLEDWLHCMACSVEGRSCSGC